MKTSDRMIIKCMKFMQGSLVQLRLLGSFEYSNEQAPSDKARIFIMSTQASCRMIIDCLMKDLSDDELRESVSSSEMASMRLRTLDNETIKSPERLVNDEMKKKVFRFLDGVLGNLEAYCNDKEMRKSYNLYWEMDKVHNVPLEIYDDMRIMKYGNLINK